MLRPSRPMIRPFISSDGRWTTETVCSAVWSAATRCMAVTTMSRALSWASSRARRSIARASLTASCSASSRTASSRMALASSADMPDTRSRAATCSCVGAGRGPRGSCRARARARGACGRAARACRCAGRAARRVRAGGARGRRARRAWRGPRPRPRAAGGASRPSPRGSAPSGGRGPRPRCGGPRPGGLHRLGCPQAPDEHAEYGSADGGHNGHRHDHGVSISDPPVRPVGSTGGLSVCRWHRARGGDGRLALGDADPLRGPRSTPCLGTQAPLGRRWIHLPRSLRAADAEGQPSRYPDATVSDPCRRLRGILADDEP